MNENKHVSRELPPANRKSQIWADEKRETVNRKPQFLVCSKMTKPRSYGLLYLFSDTTLNGKRIGAKVSLVLVLLEQTKMYGTIRLLTLSTWNIYVRK